MNSRTQPFAIRPLEIKHLFDFAIRLYRFNFGPLFLSMAVVQLPLSLLSLPLVLALLSAVEELQNMSLTGETSFDGMLATFAETGLVVLFAAVGSLVYQLLVMPLGNLACAKLAERAVHGERWPVEDAFRFSLKRYWPTQVALATFVLPLLLLSVLVLLPVLAFNMSGNESATISSAILGLLLILFGSLATVMLFYRFFPALLGVVQAAEEPEGEGILAQGLHYLKRSYGLTKGFYLRCAGLLLAVYFVVSIISQGLADAINLSVMLVEALTREGSFSDQMVQLVSNSQAATVNPFSYIMIMVVSLIFPPFIRCYLTLMYVDLRCRKEAYDLRLILGLEQAAQQPAGG